MPDIRVTPPRTYLDVVLGLSSPHQSEMKLTGSSLLNDPVVAGGCCTPGIAASLVFKLILFDSLCSGVGFELRKETEAYCQHCTGCVFA